MLFTQTEPTNHNKKQDVSVSNSNNIYNDITSKLNKKGYTGETGFIGQINKIFEETSTPIIANEFITNNVLTNVNPIKEEKKKYRLKSQLTNQNPDLNKNDDFLPPIFLILISNHQNQTAVPPFTKEAPCRSQSKPPNQRK